MISSSNGWVDAFMGGLEGGLQCGVELVGGVAIMIVTWLLFCLCGSVGPPPVSFVDSHWCGMLALL